MFSQNYSYAERPAALILGRRGFLKVSGLCIGAAVVCGWAIGDMVSRRSSIILARQGVPGLLALEEESNVLWELRYRLG